MKQKKGKLFTLKKNMNNRMMPQTAQKQVEMQYKTTVDIAVIPTCHVDVQPMARAVLGAVELIILSKCAEARAEGYQEMGTGKKTRIVMACAKMLRKLRWQHRRVDMVR